MVKESFSLLITIDNTHDLKSLSWLDKLFPKTKIKVLIINEL